MTKILTYLTTLKRDTNTLIYNIHLKNISNNFFKFSLSYIDASKSHVRHVPYTTREPPGFEVTMLPKCDI